jgi:serine/threonine-protein kinase
VGTTLNSALATLERSSLRLGKTETQPVGDAKPGTIIRQSPEAGATAAAGAAVDVVVAATPPAGPVRVPDLIGLTAQDSETALARAGLREGRSSTRRAPAYARVGTIIEQSPAAGTQVRRGTSVNVVIAGN